MVGINPELVDHNIWADTSHVLVGAGKAIMVLLKELDKHKVEVEADLGANLNCMIWKI